MMIFRRAAAAAIDELQHSVVIDAGLNRLTQFLVAEGLFRHMHACDAGLRRHPLVNLEIGNVLDGLDLFDAGLVVGVDLSRGERRDLRRWIVA